jgi:hypothetical protein
MIVMHDHCCGFVAIHLLRGLFKIESGELLAAAVGDDEPALFCAVVGPPGS